MGSRATLDTKALLGLVERGWSLRLRGRGLAAEAEPERDPDVLKAVARALSTLRGDAARLDAAGRWPACVVLALTGTLSRDYRPGSSLACWWWTDGRRHPTPRDMAQWGRAARKALAGLGLESFPELSPGEALLLHTGVPDAYLDELWRLLAHGPDAASKAVPGSPPALLLSHGKEAARPLLDRCRALLDALDSGAPLPTDLPERFAVRAGELSAQGALARGSADAETEKEPALVLEPFGRGLLLHVPGCWPDPEVTADGRRLDACEGAGQETEGARYTVPAPAVALSVRSAGRLWRLPPEWSQLPLVFDEDGQALSGAAPLPPEAVWLLHPQDAAPTADAPLRAVAHSRMPLGWPGWRLVQVCLDDASWLRWPGDETARRPVRGRARPRLLTGDPVPGLRTGHGALVYGQPPLLRLPAGAVRWQAEIRRPGGTLLARHTLAPGDTGALWEGVPRPLLGEYTVRVHGAPCGLRRTVALAEGLEVVSRPAVRLPQEDGLEPAEVLLRSPAGMTVAPSALLYGPETASRQVDLVVGEHSQRLTVTPPRMRVAIDGLPDPGGGSLRLDPGLLAAAGTLRIDLPAARRPPPLELLVDGLAVQRLEPYRDGSYNLRRLLDTAAARPGAALVLTHEGRRAQIARLEIPPLPAADPWLPEHAGPAESPG